MHGLDLTCYVPSVSCESLGISFVKIKSKLEKRLCSFFCFFFLFLGEKNIYVILIDHV